MCVIEKQRNREKQRERDRERERETEKSVCQQFTNYKITKYRNHPRRRFLYVCLNHWYHVLTPPYHNEFRSHATEKMKIAFCDRSALSHQTSRPKLRRYQITLKPKKKKKLHCRWYFSENLWGVSVYFICEYIYKKTMFYNNKLRGFIYNLYTVYRHRWSPAGASRRFFESVTCQAKYLQSYIFYDLYKTIYWNFKINYNMGNNFFDKKLIILVIIYI